MHCNMDDIWKWTGAQATHQDILQFLHCHHASHVGNRCCCHWYSGCAAAGIRARCAGVDCHGYHTVSHRDGTPTDCIHGGKDCGGWWKAILGLLHSCGFGLPLIYDGHTYCSWESFAVIGSCFGSLLVFVLGLIFLFGHNSFMDILQWGVSGFCISLYF